jgi:hypothetical protein
MELLGIDVSTLQSPVLLILELSTLQRPMLYLDVSTLPNRGMCCTYRRAYTTEAGDASGCAYLYTTGDVYITGGFSCIWTCLHYRGLCCTWTCLQYRGRICTLTCIHCRGLHFFWKFFFFFNYLLALTSGIQTFFIHFC